MKKILIYLTFSVLLFIKASAQNPPVPEAPNLQGVKIAFITKELSLTTDEAQKFWPLYFGFSDKVKLLRKEQNVDELAFEEKLLEERKKLKVELKKVFGSENRANKALGVEREFNKVLKKELEDRGRAQLQKMENHTDKLQNKVDNHLEKHQQKMDTHMEKQQQKLDSHKGPKNY